MDLRIFPVMGLLCRDFSHSQSNVESDILKYQSSVRTRKLLVMATINIPLVAGLGITMIHSVTLNSTAADSMIDFYLDRDECE
jgi:hypothetical protein